MPNSFTGIETATRALQAFQRELDVTGNNVANVNTTGYSRQTVDLKATTPLDVYQGKLFELGTGVSVGAVTRVRDQFLVDRLQTVNSSQSKVSAEKDGLSRIDTSLQEPGDSGISSALTAFYDAWSGMASGTQSSGAQSKVLTAAQTLTDKVKQLYSSISDEKQGYGDKISQGLKDLQTKVNSVADLNKQIADQQNQGVDANTLLDQRDALVQDISKLSNIRVTQNSDGTINLNIGQLTLVDKAGARTVPTQYDFASGSLVDSSGTKFPVTGGLIGGNLDLMQKATSYQGDLDNLANSLKTSFNTLYQTATNSAGVTGKNFFADANPQTGAVDFSVDSYISQSASNIAAGTTGKPGDGGIATQLSQARNTAQSALGNKSPKDFYNDLVNRIAQDTSYAKSATDTQNGLLTQVTAQISSVSGVSIDDEMANMMRFQRSYQAAAKVLTTLDDTTQTLLGIIK